MKVNVAVIGALVIGLLPAFAQAGFAIHGSAVSSTEVGLMGDRSHENEQGRGAFRVSPADLHARQQRLEGADLLVDLAYRSVTQRGTGEAAVVEGFAEDVPFATGISMILPDSWQLYKAPNLEKSKVPQLITFAGGETWPDVLAQLGDRYALQFHIDWYDRVVMMKPGKPGVLAAVQRVRIIEEPVPEPVVEETPAADEAVASAAADDGKVLSGDVAGAASAGEGVQAASTAVAAQDIEVAPSHNMLVLKGTLFENVKRLSELNGWNPPQWSIDGDYRINADYTITAETFAEAMAKLLYLHPIDAEVNLSQRKVYVIKEIH